MKLQELMISLIQGAPQTSAVYLVDCLWAIDEDFAESIKDATVLLCDSLILEKPPGLFIGSTSYLTSSIEHLTQEDIIEHWPAVCSMMDW